MSSWDRNTARRAHLSPFQRIGYVNPESSYQDVSLSAGGWFVPGAAGPMAWPTPVPLEARRSLAARVWAVVRRVVGVGVGRRW